jgi:hypothetical protein
MAAEYGLSTLVRHRAAVYSELPAKVEFELVNVQEIAHARAILKPEQRFRFVSPLLDIACKIMHFRQAEAVRLIW